MLIDCLSNSMEHHTPASFNDAFSHLEIGEEVLTKIFEDYWDISAIDRNNWRTDDWYNFICDRIQFYPHAVYKQYGVKVDGVFYEFGTPANYKGKVGEFCMHQDNYCIAIFDLVNPAPTYIKIKDFKNLKKIK